MLKISTKKFDPTSWPEGVWAQYAPGARLKIRKLNSDVLRELRRPHVRVEMEMDRISRRLVPVEKVQDDEFERVVNDYLIEDQEGFGDEEGRPIEMNEAGKKALLNDLTVRDFVWAFAQSQEVIAAEKREEEVKN